MGTSRNVVGNSVHLLLSVVFRDGRSFHIGYGDIVRFACQVIIGHYPQPLGEAERYFVVHLFGRQADCKGFGFFFQSTGEHLCHGTFLHIQIVEHDFELRSVLRHIICFATQQCVFAFADVVDFFGYQFRHFCSGSCHEYFFSQKFARVYGFLRSGGDFGCRYRTAAKRHVDGTYNAVFGQFY